MFKEFDLNTLEEWNHLSAEQKTNAIAEGEVLVAVDIDIKIERHHQLAEEHKYYQVYSHGNSRLMNDILVSKITEEETIFVLTPQYGDNDSMKISVKIDEEKEIEVGKTPYTSTYKVKVSNVRYGQIFEL